MPKSYEMKLREAEERRRPRPKEEVYKAIEKVPTKMCVGFDHPETLQLEMRLTWLDDTYTMEMTHDLFMAETRRLDAEYKRRPLRCNYGKKYLWFDRYVMRPQIQGTLLTLQDYDIQPGYRIKVNGFYQAEQMWGQPHPFKPHLERPQSKWDPDEDPRLLRRLDKGPPNVNKRVFVFAGLAGGMAQYQSMAAKFPSDLGCFMIDLPTRGDRDLDDNYPTGEFAIEVIGKTISKEMKKSGNNYFFAHSQGSHLAYYCAKKLKREFGCNLKGFFLSNFPVPAAVPPVDISTLKDRNDLCCPLRVIVGKVKQGWGVNTRLAYRNHMGYNAYQSQELWPEARALISDHWMTKDFPLPGADEPLDCPIAALYGKDDLVVSFNEVEEWKGLSSSPNKFDVIKVDGNHAWAETVQGNETLAGHLQQLVARFA